MEVGAVNGEQDIGRPQSRGKQQVDDGQWPGVFRCQSVVTQISDPIQSRVEYRVLVSTNTEKPKDSL